MPQRTRRHSSLSLDTLERFCHSIGQSLRGGASLVDALRLYGRSGKWDPEPAVAAILNGDTAASALDKSQAFPPLLIGMVEVGEASGKLDETFLRLADFYRELKRSQRVLRQGIFWPLLQLVAAACVLGLLFFALDYLQRTFTVVVAPDLFGLGLQPLQNMALVFGTAGAIVVLVVVFLWRLSRGKMPLASLWRHVPGVGATWRRIVTSRFAWAFGAAIDAGTDAVTAVRLAIRGSADASLKKVESQLVDSLQRGATFETALAATKRFPPELIHAVALGESTGQVTECVQRLSEDYEEQNAMALRRFGQVSGTAFSLSIAVLLGFTIVSMYSQYLQMVNGALRANSQTLTQMREAVASSITDNEQLAAVPGRSPVDALDSSLADEGVQAHRQASSAEDSDNELIQTRDRMVQEFVRNNDDFGKIQSLYTTLGRYNEMTPNEFLDAIAGQPRASREPSVQSETKMPTKDTPGE